MKYFCICFLFLLVLSCNKISEKRRAELWSMVRSNNVDSIIVATMEIQKGKDSSMINAILYKADDPRITHRPFQKGMSVYQVKMTALKQIINLDPPKKITYQVDTSIINFYINSLK